LARISEESHLRPKPMIEVAGRPILWRIMKLYGHHGITEIVICCGYVKKESFANCCLRMSDVTFDMSSNTMEVHHRKAEPWKLTLVDMGETMLTGRRMKRVGDHLDRTFCLTYGDSMSDVNMSDLLAFHRKTSAAATVTAIQPEERFGALEIANDRVTAFEEKPRGDGRWTNGGFFVCEPSVLDLIEGDQTSWESMSPERLARKGQLAVYQCPGCWAAMDRRTTRPSLSRCGPRVAPRGSCGHEPCVTGRAGVCL
jgi:glucose-1-phosphate cytidylyltransferase